MCIDSGRRHTDDVSRAYGHLKFRCCRQNGKLLFLFSSFLLHFPFLATPARRVFLLYIHEYPYISYIHSLQSRYFGNSRINQPMPLHNLRRIPFSKNWENAFDNGNFLETLRFFFIGRSHLCSCYDVDAPFMMFFFVISFCVSHRRLSFFLFYLISALDATI